MSRSFSSSSSSIAGLVLALMAAGLTGCGSAEASSGSTDDSALHASTADASISAEVASVLGNLRSTRYQHDSQIDSTTGIYDTDCSGFVDYVLQTVRTDAYAELQQATTDRAYAGSYVSFIGALSDAQPQWRRIVHAKYLVAGDVIAWLIPAGVDDTSDTGHVMFVEDAPVIDDAGDEATVNIVDSTDTGHGDADPRSSGGASGVGRGTIVLTLDDEGVPTGYRWSTDSDSPAYATTVVMARVD